MVNTKLLKNKKRLRVIACIQARMGSTRLKKKALRKILGKTLIEHIFLRLKKAKELDGIVLSTSLNRENDVLTRHAKEIGLEYYRGSEKDLISRLYQTAKKFRADAIVRITGDCPLVAPELVDKMIKIYRRKTKKIDLVTNIFPPTFADGLDVEVLSLAVLKQLNTEVKEVLGREWLTCHIMENPERFQIYNLKNSVNLSSMRWTVDYPEDLAFVEEIFKAFDGEDKIFTLRDVLNFLEKNPQILKINANRIDKTIARGIRSAAYHKLIKGNKIQNK